MNTRANQILNGRISLSNDQQIITGRFVWQEDGELSGEFSDAGQTYRCLLQPSATLRYEGSAEVLHDDGRQPTHCKFSLKAYLSSDELLLLGELIEEGRRRPCWFLLPQEAILPLEEEKPTPMQHFDLKARFSAPSIVIDIPALPPRYRRQNGWQHLIRELTFSWIRRNQFQQTGTVWMWLAPTQQFHSLAQAAFISQHGFPRGFLKHLQQELRRRFGEHQVTYADEMAVRVERGWKPVCHAQGSHLWYPRDAVGWGWNEFSPSTKTAAGVEA